MSQDFINRAVDAALAEKIRNARSPQEIRDVCVESGERVGVLVRDRTGEVSVRDEFVVPQQPAPQPAPQDDQLLRRAVTINGVTRLLEAWSASGLDTLQKGFEREMGLAGNASHTK